jgi:hypothetical protein
MRAVLAVDIADAGRDQVEATLRDLGWLPRQAADSGFAERRRKEILDQLPESVREEIADTDPILVDVSTGLWGLASTERQRLLVLRLPHHSLDLLKHRCEQIVVDFPRAFAAATGRSCAFRREAEIQRFDSEELIARGRINLTRETTLLSYLRAQRPRERTLLVTMAALTAFTTVLSLAAFVSYPASDTASYLRGYLDRGATVFFTACLTTLVNLAFEYRQWRSSTAVVQWTDA